MIPLLLLSLGQAQEVHRNPDADMTLVRLNGSATTAALGLEPIPLFAGTLDEDWIGAMAEAALDWIEGVLGSLDELDMGGQEPGEEQDGEDTGLDELPDYTTGEGWWEPIEWR
jgi:hypothetical protein